MSIEKANNNNVVKNNGSSINYAGDSGGGDRNNILPQRNKPLSSNTVQDTGDIVKIIDGYKLAKDNTDPISIAHRNVPFAESKIDVSSKTITNPLIIQAQIGGKYSVKRNRYSLGYPQTYITTFNSQNVSSVGFDGTTFISRNIEGSSNVRRSVHELSDENGNILIDNINTSIGV